VSAEGVVRFAFEDATATRVEVIGSFADWQPIDMERGPAGLWVATVRGVRPGLHQYKYRVDGRWSGDPAHRLSRDDGHNGRNGAFLVGGPGPKTGGAIRVASLNLHTYQEKEPLRCLEDIALCLAAYGVDLALLQEVAAHVSDPALPNAGETLQGHLQRFSGRPWHHAWGEAHIGFEVFHEGLSLLSVSPIDEAEVLRLRGGFLARVAIAGRVRLGGESIRVTSVHTTWAPEGDGEVDALLVGLGRHGLADAATLVGGDFNGGPSSAHVRKLRLGGFLDAGTATGEERPTYLDAPQNRIDYQFVRSRVGGATLVPRRSWRIFDGEGEGFQPRVSDHAGLLVEYEWA
jgi:maltose 6'-phosphate phosphatase